MPTGPGHYDDEGVWQYGEDDEATLSSDLANIGQQSISDQFELVRADIENLQDPPDTGSFTVMPWNTATVPVGRCKFAGTDGTNNWSNINNDIWQGVSHRRRSEMVYVAGACNRNGSTAAALTTIFTLPLGLRPTTTQPGMAWASSGATYVLCRPTGEVQCATSVTGQLTFSLSFIAAAV